MSLLRFLGSSLAGGCLDYSAGSYHISSATGGVAGIQLNRHKKLQTDTGNDDGKQLGVCLGGASSHLQLGPSGSCFDPDCGGGGKSSQCEHM